MISAAVAQSPATMTKEGDNVIDSTIIYFSGDLEIPKEVMIDWLVNSELQDIDSLKKSEKYGGFPHDITENKTIFLKNNTESILLCFCCDSTNSYVTKMWLLDFYGDCRHWHYADLFEIDMLDISINLVAIKEKEKASKKERKTYKLYEISTPESTEPKGDLTELYFKNGIRIVITKNPDAIKFVISGWLFKPETQYDLQKLKMLEIISEHLN